LVGFSGDGTTVTLKVGSSTNTTTQLQAIPSNANNFTILSSNTTPFTNYYMHSVNGTLQSWYQPVSMISGTVLPDRATTVVQNGAITWGSNPPGIEISVGAMTSYASSTAVSTTSTEVSDTVAPLMQPTKWINPDDADIINLPFYDTFAEKATEMEMPTRTLYAIMMLGTASAVGLSVLLFTGSALILIIGIFFTMMAAVGTKVLDAWMLFVFIALGLSILYLSRQ
jgi:hypothetical protein